MNAGRSDIAIELPEGSGWDGNVLTRDGGPVALPPVRRMSPRTGPPSKRAPAGWIPSPARSRGLARYRAGDRCKGDHAVRHTTVLDTVVRAFAGAPWTTPPRGTGVLPGTPHPRGEAHRRKEAVEPPAYRRDLRLHPLHDRDDRSRSAETGAGRIVVKPGCAMKSPRELRSGPVEAEALKLGRVSQVRVLPEHQRKEHLRKSP